MLGGFQGALEPLAGPLDDISKRRYTQDDHARAAAALEEAARRVEAIRSAFPLLDCRPLAAGIAEARNREQALWLTVKGKDSFDAALAAPLLSELSIVAQDLGALADKAAPSAAASGKKLELERLRRQLQSESERIGSAAKQSPAAASAALARVFGEGTGFTAPEAVRAQAPAAPVPAPATTPAVKPAPVIIPAGSTRDDHSPAAPGATELEAGKAVAAAAAAALPSPLDGKAQEQFNEAQREALQLDWAKTTKAWLEQNRAKVKNADAALAALEAGLAPDVSADERRARLAEAQAKLGGALVAQYVAFNRDHLTKLPDGARFSPEELGLPAGQTTWTKTTVGGVPGLSSGKHWESLDGTLTRDERPDGTVAETKRSPAGLVVTVFKDGRAVSATSFTPVEGQDGLFVAAGQGGWPKSVGRFTKDGFVVEQQRNEDGSSVAFSGMLRAVAAGSALIGWSVEAEQITDADALARGITQRRGAGDAEAASLAALLKDFLSHEKNASARLTFLPDGGLVIDEKGGAGVYQVIARREGDLLTVYARETSDPSDADLLKFSRIFGYRDGGAREKYPARAAANVSHWYWWTQASDAKDAEGADLSDGSALAAAARVDAALGSGRAPGAGLFAGGATLAGLSGLASGELTWSQALLEKARGALGFDLPDAAVAFLAHPRALTVDEKAEYDKTLAELQNRPDEGYAKDKLAQRYDIKNPKPEDLAELRELKSLQDYYDGLLMPGGQSKPGYAESVDVRLAQLKALKERLEAADQNRSVRRGDGTTPPVDQATLDKIKALLDEIETLRGEAKGELANRDATKQLLGVQSALRNEALKARRDGKNELKLHENLSRLDTVMRASFALKIILKSEEFIKEKMAAKQQEIAAAQANEAQAQQNLAQAQANAAQVAQWRAQAQQTVKSDQSTQSSIVSYEKRASASVIQFKAFQTDISAQIATVNARDKSRSADAMTEYARRLALLPTIVQWRTSGNPNDPNAFSLKQFTDLKATVDQKLKDAQAGLSQLSNPSNAVNFAGVVINAVPGPTGSFTNRSDLRAIITARKADYTSQRADYQKDLDSITRMTGQSDSKGVPPGTSIDEFGDPHPESLPKWRDQASAEESQAQGRVRDFLARIDAAAAQINSVAGSNIPMLAAKPLADLQTALKTYGDTLKAVHIGDDTDAQHQASLNLILIADLLPRAADDVVTWSKDDGIVKAINDALATTLPQAQTGIRGVVAMIDAIIADCDKDLGWINSTSGESDQGVFDRKLALVKNTIIPALQSADGLVDVLISYQKTSVAQAQPNTGDLWTLYDAKQTLMQQTLDLYNKTVPWGLASFGGSEGDAAGSHASIKSWRDNLSKYMSPNGYDDANGHEESVPQFQADVAHRKDPNYNGTEVLYGETQPYSLPKKISQYTSERASRAPQINANDQQVNDILAQIEQLAKGKYSFGGLRMPVGVTADAAGVARVQAVVDAHTINQLSDKLKAIGNDANANSGTLQVGSGGGDTGFPTGTQPPIVANDMQRIALMCVDAGKRLVPTAFNAANPDQGNATFAIARFLYSDSVVSAAQDALQNQVPVAETFLNEAAAVLNAAIASTNVDDAYVDSGGKSESPDAIYARQIALFQNLDRMLVDGNAFFNQKIAWDQAPANPGGTIDKVSQYYSSLVDIYNGAISADQNIITADQKILTALQTTFDSLEQNRTKLAGWLAQLDDPHDSALRRVNESISDLQDQTRAVLEQNLKWHDLNDQLDRSNEILKSELGRIDDKQSELSRLLSDPRLQDALPPDLVARIDKLKLGRGMWDLGGQGGEAIVVRKSQFASFVDAIMGLFANQSSTPNLALLKSDILSNPASLSSLIPDAQLIDFGGGSADGFYLVYQTNFSVPNGLNTESWVTLGNVGKIWGNNISVAGYQFSSPPEDTNAPYGDKGVEVKVESLQGRNWVNYLDIDLHRFAFDIPPDMQTVSQVNTSRVMIFDDFAVMLMGDRLYVGAAGFGDISMSDPGGQPSYYGGNIKTSLKLTEVMKLNAEQQVLFAKDPQQFLQNVQVSGYDSYLNGTIYAKADDKNYYRTQIGPSIDVGRLISNAEGKPAPADTFTVDLFWSKTGGTDDINQQAVGASILKGFTIKDDSGKPWMVIQNKVTGELGQQYNTLTDKLSITLPNYGVVISGQGELLGDAKAYYASIAKKMGDNSTVEVSYGAPYVGLNDRLAVTMNSAFTLGQLWQSVIGGAKQTLEGGQALQQFNKNLDDFFKAQADDKRVQELKRVWEQDVARKLLMQDMGALARQIAELRKAGAILDNTRMRGMVGWVSNPISNDTADRAVGGGFVVGTQTDISMKKTPKAQIDADLADLFVLGVKLQNDMVSSIEKWQACVVAIAQAQWRLKAETYMVKNGPTAASRQEALVKAGEAESALNQAVMEYNSLTGRDPAASVPFDNLAPADLESLTNEMRKTLALPDRLSQIIRALDPDQLKKQMGDNPFNLADYLPIVDQFTLGIGVQLQDLMANQIFGVGGTIRIPLYDPSSKAQNKAYQLESKAAAQQILEAFAEQRLEAQKRREQAQLWRQSAEAIAPGLSEAAKRLGLAIRAYRNGLESSSELDQAFDAWHWYIMAALDADARAAVAEAWAALDGSIEKRNAADHAPMSVSSIDDAIARVFAENHGLAEIALRGEAAGEMTEANDHRIQKAFVDVHVGYNLTASGVGWLPSIGITGIPVTPIPGFEFKPEELRELEVHRDQSQAEYYKQLQGKVRAQLAAQFAQNVIDRALAKQTLAAYDAQIAALRNGGDPQKLDAAVRQRGQAQLAFQQAEANLNFLLGRAPDAPLTIDVTPEQALASLRTQLAALRPVETQKAILDSRVKVAHDVETIADKDLKVEQLALEPISLTVRSLSRLISALGGDHIGNPDLVAAARVQTLTEERARESYDAQVKAGRAQARAELSRVEAELSRLDPSSSPDAQLARLALEQRIFTLKAALLALEDDPDAAPAGRAPVPSSFAELKNRLEQSERDASAQAPDAPVANLDPAALEHQASSFARYYYAHETLGKTPIDKSFTEGWLEVRLKSQDTPPEVLLALSKLRDEKADRIYRTQLSGADARADVLVEDFKADVQVLRWARRAIAAPRGSELQLQGNLDEFARQIALRLADERDALVAKLDLPPGTSLERLEALVPDDASGARDLPAMAERFLKDVRDLQLDRIKQTLFDGAPPPSFGTEDNLINQLKADTIAERMSYKGFTPVAAFGIFRGQTVSGGFLEAPDPRAIEAGLENVLTDALRKELVSTGRMQELTLRLHSLMSRVEDGSRQIERRKDLVAVSEAEYKALMGRARTPAELAEAERARGRVVEAWLGFTQQLTDTKADFISLVTELEALGAGDGSGLRPFVPPVPELSPLERDSRAELLAYWADRFKDFNFPFEAFLDSLEPPVPVPFRQRLRSDVAMYRLALYNADVIRHKDFTEAEKLDLLARTDSEGRRMNLVSDLDELLKSAPEGAKAKLMAFLRGDLDSQTEVAGADRARYIRLSTDLRDAYWKGTGGGPDGLYPSLEAKAKVLDAAKQRLLERYLTEVGDDPSRFILKDVDLDAYLRAQEDFDRELIATLQKPEVRGDQDLARTLDALYGVRGALDRRMAQVRSGRGMGALDALIMLQNARLSAARWDQRPPDELDAISRRLEDLKELRARWDAGSVDLAPLYAVTTVDKDGKRQWSVEGWLTRQEVDAAVKAGTIVERGGKLYMGEREVVGGIDAADDKRDDARRSLDQNDARLTLAGRLDRYDFALDRPAKDGSEGLSLDQVYGQGGKNQQGRVFYFEAPQPGEAPGRLHSQLNPLQALSLPPEKYVMLVYDGDQPLSRDRYPTLESLRGSDDEKDFVKATLSARGAAALVAEAEKKRASELAKGWLDVKLNSYAFARAADGSVAEVYTSEDDYNAVVKAFKNAEQDLAKERRELADAQAEDARAKAEVDARKAAADAAAADYQRAQLKVRERVLADLKRTFPPRPQGESDQVYQARLKVELDRRVAQDSEFKAAQKAYEPVAKAFNDAADKYKLAHAKVLNAAKAVDEGVALLSRSKTWSLYLSDNVSLGLDKDGAVISIAAAPVYGSLALNDHIQTGTAALVVNGPIYAAEFDGEGRLKARWQDMDAVARASAGWTLKSVVMKGEDDQVSPDGRVTKPVYRLSHYEDSSSGLPVSLSRRYMIDRVKDAQSSVSRDKNWGLMPWNWGNLLLELPRGVVGAPIELITGRDPNQQHYLGRIYMYKTEGGETEHHGFFRKVAGVIDVLNFLPDPVSRFYDPSQFPSRVVVDSRVQPGQSVIDKDARDGDHDVHFGLGSAQRTLNQSLEDLTTARARTLAHFHGGAEETMIEAIRGRAGEYEESKRIAASGEAALKRALSDPLVGGDPFADGSGTVVSGARPGNIAVDRVERQVRVLPGADQYDAQKRALDGYDVRLGSSTRTAQDAEAALRAELAARDRELNAAKADRARSHTAREQAIEQAILVSDKQPQDTGWLARWQAYVKQLYAALAKA